MLMLALMLMLTLMLMLMRSAVGDISGVGGCYAVVAVEDETVRPDEAAKGEEGSAAAGRSLAREAGTPWTWPIELERLWRVPRMLAKLESPLWGRRPVLADGKAMVGERVSWDQMLAGWSTVAVEVPAPYEAGEITEESAKAVETPAPMEAWSASSSV